MYKGLNRLSSPDDKRNVADAVYESLMDYFFDKIVFINLAFSDFGGGGNISTTDYDTSSRIIDTAEGRLMAPGRNSRLRCQFYLKNPSKMTGYILSPCVYDSQTLPSPLTDMSVFRSYVGLKFSGGNVYAVSKQAGNSEVTFLLDLTLSMFDTTFTDTYTLEIRHNITNTEIIINNESYGSFSSDMVGDYSTVETFYPFFSTAISTESVKTAGSFTTGVAYQIVTVGTTDFTLIGAASNTVGVNFTATGSGTGTGTASALVNITSENIQFIQSKQ